MGQRTHVLVGIVNWNGGALLEACLDAVAALERDGARLECVVVDNASGDGSAEAAAARPGVEVIRNTRNLDYVAAANQAVRLARQRGAAFVWLVNPDVFPAPDCLRLLLEAAAREPAAGLFSPVLFDPSRPGAAAHGGYRIRWATGRLAPIRLAPPVPAATEPVEAIMGCALLVRCSLFERLGLLPELYGAYFEEIEFQVRAARAGVSTLRVGGARAWHHVAASYDRVPWRRARRLLVNLWRFQRRNAPRPAWRVFVPYYCLVHVPWFLLRGTWHVLRRRTRGAAGASPPPSISA